MRRAAASLLLAGLILAFPGSSVAAPKQKVDGRLTPAQARAIVTPWYSLFTISGRDVETAFDKTIGKDFQSCAGDRPSDCQDRQSTKAFVTALGALIPDMTFQIKELFVVGDRVIVRGEASGTPAGPLFGAPPTGRRFRIMTIDVLTLANGKITRTYHLENWLAALDQIRTDVQ